MGATSMDVAAVDPEKLSGFLSEHLFEDRRAVTVTDIKPASSGFSNDTVLFEVAYDEDGQSRRHWLVARIEPTRPALFMDYDIKLQHGVMAALSEHSDLPMPTIRGQYDDASTFGAPFFLMDRVFGRIPPDDPPFTKEGWLLDLPPEQQASILDQSLVAMAKTHAVDWRALNLGPVVGHDPDQDALRAKLAEFDAFHRWVAGDIDDPMVVSTLAWLNDNIPSEDEELVLNWGDPRIGNMIFDPETNDALAVLDWEMSCIASRELDLGWYTFALRYFTEGIGAPMPPGFPDIDGIVVRYEELSGHAVGNHHYYEVVAGLRNAIHMRRIANLLSANGLLPAGSDMATNNPATHILARLLGLPAPGPTAGTFQRG